jgi:hypothetical protein
MTAVLDNLSSVEKLKVAAIVAGLDAAEEDDAVGLAILLGVLPELSLWPRREVLDIIERLAVPLVQGRLLIEDPDNRNLLDELRDRSNPVELGEALRRDAENDVADLVHNARTR